MEHGTITHSTIPIPWSIHTVATLDGIWYGRYPGTTVLKYAAFNCVMFGNVADIFIHDISLENVNLSYNIFLYPGNILLSFLYVASYLCIHNTHDIQCFLKILNQVYMNLLSQ